MALKFNNETPAKIIYNGNSVSKVKYGTETVWVAFESKEFEYTGDIQSWTVPVTGTYELQVWGAQGGNYTETKNNIVTIIGNGGKGGYSKGNINLVEGQTIYIAVGGCPGNNNKVGGYNGGATSTTPKEFVADCGGGGATHIAIESRGNGELFNYKDRTNELLIVAGGGGGATYNGDGGYGGYENGGDSEHAISSNYTYYCGGGGQNGVNESKAKYIYVNGVYQQAIFEGTFGRGGFDNNPADIYCTRGGGGGGYYGGSTYMYENIISTTTNHNVGGGGGSGYIGGDITNAETQNGTNTGNGKAKIKLILD